MILKSEVLFLWSFFLFYFHAVYWLCDRAIIKWFCGYCDLRPCNNPRLFPAAIGYPKLLDQLLRVHSMYFGQRFWSKDHWSEIFLLKDQCNVLILDYWVWIKVKLQICYNQNHPQWWSRSSKFGCAGSIWCSNNCMGCGWCNDSMSIWADDSSSTDLPKYAIVLGRTYVEEMIKL